MMASKIRLWCHEGWWRIQLCEHLKDRHGTLYDVWRSHRRYGLVMLFETPEQARVYMRDGGKEKQDD